MSGAVRAFRSQRALLSHNRAAIRGLRDQSGSSAHLYHKGVYVAVHSAAPPPVEVYDQWIADNHPLKRRCGGAIEGRKLRRMVVMRRQGSSLKECGEAVGHSKHFARSWLSLLPTELGA